jgi:hypothetical protein
VTSREIFYQLTDKKYLQPGHIGGDSAWILLSAEHCILGNDQQEGGDGELSDLQIRCVAAIASNKRQLGQLMPGLYDQHYKHFSPAVQKEILKALMKC